MNMNFEISSPSTMLVNDSSDNQRSLESPSSLSSSSSSLFSSSSYSSYKQTSGNCFTLEAHLPLVKTNIEQLDKFKRLLTRLDHVYNNHNMATTTLPPPSSSHVTDRYLFRSLSNDNQNSRIPSTTTRKNKLPSNGAPSSSTPPALKKRYKFSPVATDQNNNNVYKFPNGHTEQRSHSTDSNRYYFPPDDSSRKPQQTLTYVRSGTGPEQHSVSFIGGASATPDKVSSLTTKSIQGTNIIPDTPYLFSKTTESQRHPSATSSVNPEDSWIHQRQQPHIVFDSVTDSSPAGHLKRPRTTSMSPDHRHASKRSPTRMDTVTSTNGSLSTIRRSPPNKPQNVRFDSSLTPRSYLDQARQRLAGKKRGRSPQAYQQSVERLVLSTNQYYQQQILSPPHPFQQQNYISQYYAHEEEPPIDYLADSDEDEQQKRSLYNRGLNTNRTHQGIMKNVNKSLIDRNYNRIKQFDQRVQRQIRSIENQSLQRELNHDLIRCFSSAYLHDLRREENRHFQTRINARSYTYEDVQDIHMAQVLEAYKMKKAINDERRLRLSMSFDGQISSSTPTSSIGAGYLSSLLSSPTPMMTGSFNENIDAQSAGFETDRRSQPSTSQTPTNLRSSHGAAGGPNLDLFSEIMREKMRGVDASIAGQVSTASQYFKTKGHLQPTTSKSQTKPFDNESDVDIRSNSSFWSDEEEEQQHQPMDHSQARIIPHQKQISRYLSTVNRSLLDRPSDLIADFYISKLNQSMQDSVKQVETIARDKALMRQKRNREFIDEPTSKLGRSLSAEHLYEVRKEHLRYKQPFTTPTSFTVEDVADIYKPFVLENYKRKIAIELERRRRERQIQLMAGINSPPMYTSDTELNEVLRPSRPPIREIPIIPIGEHQRHSADLTRSRIVRTNDPAGRSTRDNQRNDLIVVRPPVVQTKEIFSGRARRTLTDDGSADVVHHVGIISPPSAYSIVRTTVDTSTTDLYDPPRVTVVAPPDFVDRSKIRVRPERARTNIVHARTSELVDSSLTASQQTIIQDDGYNPTLQRSVQIITTTHSPVVSPRRPQTKIYTPAPQVETVRICQADRVESESGNYDLSMVNIRPVLTLNQGEIKELSLIAQQAQRLQIAPRDYDHAMIILSPEQTQHQHDINQQPVLLAAANIDRLHDERHEQVTQHVDQVIPRQRSQLITPVAEHMAKVEQDIAIFENISTANVVQPSRNKLNEVPHDSGIVSLNTSQASEQPVIFNASRVHRLEHSDEQPVENLHEDSYYRRSIRGSDLLRTVDTDPNNNIQPVRNYPTQIFEHTTQIPSSNLSPEHTRIIDGHRMDHAQTLEHTDEPVIYESIDQQVIHQIPRREHLTSFDVHQDQQTTNLARENQVNWGKIVPQKQYQPTQSQLFDTHYERTDPLVQDQFDRRETVRPLGETTQRLESPKPSNKTTIFNYGKKNEIPISRTSSFGSDKDLNTQAFESARIEYDRRNLSSLDNVTQPISHHPPAQTQFYQQHTVTDIDEEPMGVREETALENEVSYDGSLGRASLRKPIQSLNAPRTLAQPDFQALLLEELATDSTAAHKQHAREVTAADSRPNLLERFEETNRIPIIVHDTDWKDEKVQLIYNESQQNAQYKYPLPIEYQQATSNLSKPILARERHEQLENNNQEITQHIESIPMPRDRSIERLESTREPFSLQQSINDQQILCRSLDHHVHMNDEQTSFISDDSLLTRHQQQSDIKLNEPTTLENPLRSTAFLTFNYPHYTQELSQSWHQTSDQEFVDQLRQQYLQYETQQISPRYLPVIESAANDRSLKESDNYVSEFRQIPLLHENVRIQQSSPGTSLLPSTQIQQARPIYRVRQQQLSANDDYNYSTISPIHPDQIDRINTTHLNSQLVSGIHVQPPPVTVDIEVRVRPSFSETSSLVDMESFLNRFEDSLEPEQHLPLVDQISLSYTTSMRSIQDDTQRAIERYEREHPFFSRSLPYEWLRPTVHPQDEQLVEQWTVERNLETIQPQIEVRTNTECTSAVVVTTTAAAIAIDAYLVGERFEEGEEESNSLNTKAINEEQANIHVASAVLVSHCSPTSDYETDSLDKDNDTTSTTNSVDVGLIVNATPVTTTTVPSDSSDAIPAVPVDYLLDRLAHEPADQNDVTKDFLLSIGFGRQETQDIHRAKENALEHNDEHAPFHPFDDNEHEFLNLFFEPAHFHLPLINEISIYQISFDHQYSSSSPTNFLLPTIHHDGQLSSNTYQTNQQDILSIAQINQQSDREEDLESISCKYDSPSCIEQYHIQPLDSVSQTLHVHVDEPPTIIEKEDEPLPSSHGLPDIVPSTTNEDYIQHDSKEVTILPTSPVIDSTSFHLTDRTERAQQSTERYNLESLPEQKYVEINIATPTPSMRTVRPSRPGIYTDTQIMDSTATTRTDRYERDDLKYAQTTTSRNQSDNLPPKHLPSERKPDLERARLVPSSAISPRDTHRDDEVLIRDTIVQHISEDEKSTSSEEVIFEEWNEVFSCRRTDEFDRRTDALLRTVIDETSERVKSDVIKEEYREKNERIKGHKSYDVVKEVYRRVPAHTVDPTTTTVVSIDPAQSHVYEEIPQPPRSTSSLSDRQIPADPSSQGRHWSSEDIYTTEIVYDPKTVHDIASSTAHFERIDTKYDSATPPSSTTNYDRVRPGQYQTIPSTAQATVSTVPSSNYDRISNIVTSSTHFADRRQQERDAIVSEEYHVELEQHPSEQRSSSSQRQTSTTAVKQQRDETSEEDASDSYVTVGDTAYGGLTTIVNEAGRRRDSDWRNKLKEVYTPTSDDDRFDQFGKRRVGNYTAQRVSIEPPHVQQRFKEVQVKIPTRDKLASEQNQFKTSPPSRHAVKEILVCVSRGPSPEKQLHQQIYHLRSSSDEDEQNNERLVAALNRSRETTTKITSTSRTDNDRPEPSRRSVSSSSIIDERRARFEQQQIESPTGSSTTKTDRLSTGRVGELKNAFESTTTGNGRDESSKYKSPASTTLTEQRRKMFEEQEQTHKEWTPTNRRSLQSTNVVPQRRVHRISGRRQKSLTDDYQSNERRISETHTAPSRVTERISRIETTDPKSTSRVQPTDRLGRTGFDTVKSSFESTTTKPSELSSVPQTSIDITIRDKRIISSLDSDASGASPPIYQSTPKSTKQQHDEDPGHESEDELSDPANRRRPSKTRLRDFSQSTSQAVDSTYLSQRTKSSFNETNMENILSHVPASKGKGLLIELSPHLSAETPITSTTIKPGREPHAPFTGSESGIFEYSTATSHHPGTSSASWRNNLSSTIIDEANRTPSIRDSGVYLDSAATTIASSRYSRRQPSDTDQTTIHGGDDSLSRSTYKYETEIISSDQFNQNQNQQQQQKRLVHRQRAGSPPSEYENIANYHSGLNSQRQVPITTYSRSIAPKPLVVDEIETIETETRVECQVQRTHEIKESTTKTQPTGDPHAPKKITTTTTTTTTTTALPSTRSPESSSDEFARTATPSKRVLLNERPQYYDSTKATDSPITVRSPQPSAYTPTHEIRQQTQTYRESGIHQHRYDSPQSDSLTYPISAPQRDDLIRVEETRFVPIQRDRSQDSLLQSPSSHSNIRTLSAGPRSMEVTSFSPQNQVTFGKYAPNEIIAIVRVPELSNGAGARANRSSPMTSTIRHGTSESEIYARAKQEDEEQRARLQYQRVYAGSYRPPPAIAQDYQPRQSRSRAGPYDSTHEYSSSVNPHARSSSYHAALHDQDRHPQQEQEQYPSPSPRSTTVYHNQTQRRTGSLGNLFGPNVEFEIEIEKRPPHHPEQPTVVELDQAPRAIVTTSRDGQVSIKNVAARPGNTVVIHSDFHSSDRSLNRSSGYFSSDELRSQGLNTNYSSDEQSSGAAMNANQTSQSSNTPSTLTRRYRNNDQNTSRLPSHYRPRQTSHYQQLNSESFDKVNEIVHRYNRQSNSYAPGTATGGFNEAIDQIDALYNNLDIQAQEDSLRDRLVSQQGIPNPTSTYDFSKPTSATNRRKHLSQNNNEYSKRYSSTGFQQIPPSYEQETTTNSTVRHLVSPPILSSSADKRRHDAHRAFSDNENLASANDQQPINWSSKSLNDLVTSTPIRPSQSLASSGILADYGTPGSISPNSGFGSTQNVVVQQNRYNGQAQLVQRNRTSVKQVKQKSAAKKKNGNIQGQYSDEEDENDSAGGHDSPLSDNGRPQPPARFFNRHQ